MNEILEEMWNVLDEGVPKRTIMAAWGNILRKHIFQPRKYLAVIHLGKGHFAVESSSRPGKMHAVERDDSGNLHCVCEDFSMNKNPNCHHVKLIKRLAGEHIF